MRKHVFAATSQLLIAFGILASWDNSALLQAQQPTSANEELLVKVIQGEGFMNHVGRRVARDPVVEVQDRNNKPVADAAVTFLLPNSGPSGTFPNGSQIVTVNTNNAGRAAAVGIKSNGVKGAMKIDITASSQGRTGTTSINQTNVAAGIGAAATVGIVGALAAGTAIGLAIALGGSGGKTTKVALGTPSVQ